MIPLPVGADVFAAHARPHVQESIACSLFLTNPNSFRPVQTWACVRLQFALAEAELEHSAALQAAQLRGRPNPLQEAVWTYSVGGDHGQRGPFTLLQLLAQLRGS